MKTNLDELYKVDATAEKEGVWFDVSPKTGFLVKPFRGTNPRVKAAMAKYYKPYARQIENGQLSLEKEREININLFLDICLVDWKGVEIDGVPTPFARENALILFQELPDLFQTLLAFAQDFKTYKVELGNS